MANEKKFVVLHTLHICETPGKPADKLKGTSAVRPQIKVVEPGRSAPRFIMLDPEDQATKEFLKAGSIRLDTTVAEEPETVGKKAAPKKAAPKKTAAKPAAKPAAKKTDGEGEGEGKGEGTDTEAENLV